MKNILWIDDDSKLIDSCIPVFQENDFIIFKATNTSRALSILREHRSILDGVLLDVRLQNDEDGLELLKEIVDKYPNLKIAIFTGYPEYNDHVIAEKIGATIYFNKIDKSIPLDFLKQRNFFKALHKIFSSSKEKENIKNVNNSRNTINIIPIGLFFTFLFIVIILLIAILSIKVSPILFPVVLIASILIYSIISAFILRIQGDAYLTQRNFLELMLKSFSYLPLLKKNKDNK
jgi:ActR/RegA family two-component response regulator